MSKAGVNNAKKTPGRGPGQPFKRGNPGRPKGAKDKIPRTVKENFDKVFEKLGGIEGFYKWAKKSARNMELFYTWYSKMLPTNVTGTVNANVKVLSFDFGENGE